MVYSEPIIFSKRLNMINFLIPCYNESLRLAQSLRKLEQFFLTFSDWYRLIFINDGSKDNSLEILQLFQQKSSCPVIVLDYEQNQWKWYAIKYGIFHSPPSERYCFMDCDLATDLSEINTFYAIKESADILIGSRLSPKAQRVWFKKILWYGSRVITNIILQLHFTDTQCWFKWFHKNTLPVWQAMKINRRGFDFEFLYLATRQWYRIKEYLVMWKEMEQSKVKLSDYIKTLKELLYVRWIHRN